MTQPASPEAANKIRPAANPHLTLERQYGIKPQPVFQDNRGGVAQR